MTSPDLPPLPDLLMVKIGAVQHVQDVLHQSLMDEIRCDMRAVQLAAYRAGMEQAALILRDVPIDHAFSDTIKACQAAIRRAAEGKTNG